MSDHSGRPSVPWRGHGDAPTQHDDSESDVGAPGPAIVIPMGLAALSGFVMALLVRGEFAHAAVLLLGCVFCGFVGWWARGLQ